MSFFRNFKRSLGLDPTPDDDILDDDVSDPTAGSETSATNIRSTNEPASQAAAMPMPVVDNAHVDMIFAHVVEQFNQALPNFLQSSVNPEAQRKQLYDSLEVSIKEYLDEIAHKAQAAIESRMSSEQSSMRDEIASLQAKTREIEQQRFDIKQQQLSSDRQRRALTDRLHDLENQIGRLEAEREQFDLENKSLLNKIKVSSVHEAEAESLRQELTEAKATIQKLRLEGVSDETADEINRLNQQIESLNVQLDQAADKDRIATEMYNALQTKASESRKEAERLTEQLAEATTENDKLKSQLAEAEISRSELNSISDKLKQVEQTIDARDNKIKELKETVQSLRRDNESLQQTIANNIKDHAASEAALNETIDLLNSRIAELEAEPMPALNLSSLDDDIDRLVADHTTENEAVKISESDLRAIEESFDTADWMRSDPPQTQSMRASLPEDDFGYQAPVKKTNRPDNDAQLSLFD